MAEQLPAAVAPPSLQRAQVKAIHNDHLEVLLLDQGLPTNSRTLIAKPPELRHDASYYPLVTGVETTDEQTVVASADGTDETWVVRPPYAVDQVILVTAGLPTGLTVNVDDTDVDLTWLDLNNAGRAWAVQS